MIDIDSSRRTIYLISFGIAVFLGMAILLFMFEPTFVPSLIYDVFGIAISGTGFLYFALYSFLPLVLIIVLLWGAGDWVVSFFGKDGSENEPGPK